MFENGSVSSVPSLHSKSFPMLPEPKHPLQHRWTLWYFMNDKTIKWEENQVKVNSFDTVEDFWATMNHVDPPSELRTGCDYSLFKSDIKPMWEDPLNKSGGRWLINLDNHDKTARSRFTNRIWMESVLAMVGDTLDDDGELVNGVVVSIRPKSNKVCLWMKNSVPAESVLKIGKKLKSRLSPGLSTNLLFELHEDTMVKSSSSMKVTYKI